jgi:hypothetical protein
MCAVHAPQSLRELATDDTCSAECMYRLQSVLIHAADALAEARTSSRQAQQQTCPCIAYWAHLFCSGIKSCHQQVLAVIAHTEALQALRYLRVRRGHMRRHVQRSARRDPAPASPAWPALDRISAVLACLHDSHLHAWTPICRTPAQHEASASAAFLAAPPPALCVLPGASCMCPPPAGCTAALLRGVF